MKELHKEKSRNYFLSFFYHFQLMSPLNLPLELNLLLSLFFNLISHLPYPPLTFPPSQIVNEQPKRNGQNRPRLQAPSQQF